MNASERQAIRERADAATEGPREAYEDTEGWYAFNGRATVAAYFGQADAEFIAHARTDVPALLDEVARLERERDEAQEDRDEEHTTVEVLRGELKEAEQEVARLTAVVERVEALASKWERMAWEHIDANAAKACESAARRLRAALDGTTP